MTRYGWIIPYVNIHLSIYVTNNDKIIVDPKRYHTNEIHDMGSPGVQFCRETRYVC